jgi:hypothetical protein
MRLPHGLRVFALGARYLLVDAPKLRGNDKDKGENGRDAHQIGRGLRVGHLPNSLQKHSGLQETRKKRQ